MLVMESLFEAAGLDYWTGLLAQHSGTVRGVLNGKRWKSDSCWSPETDKHSDRQRERAQDTDYHTLFYLHDPLLNWEQRGAVAARILWKAEAFCGTEIDSLSLYADGDFGRVVGDVIHLRRDPR